MENADCDPQVISDLDNLFTTGAPKKLVASSSHESFMTYLKYRNHTSIKNHLEQTMNTINKEDRNQYLIPFPSWITRFIRNMDVTPQSLLVKKGKNDRLIWDGSFSPN